MQHSLCNGIHSYNNFIPMLLVWDVMGGVMGVV